MKELVGKVITGIYMSICKNYIGFEAQNSLIVYKALRYIPIQVKHNNLQELKIIIDSKAKRNIDFTLLGCIDSSYITDNTCTIKDNDLKVELLKQLYE